MTILGVPDRPGIAARVFRPLADAGVNIDMIVQNVSAEGHTDISFTLPKADLRAGRADPAQRSRAAVDARGFTADPDIAKVSLVGAGMKSHPGVAADMFEALADAGINIEIISTSPIRISCVVRGGRSRTPCGRARALRPVGRRRVQGAVSAEFDDDRLLRSRSQLHDRCPLSVRPSTRWLPPPSATGRTFFRSARAVVTRQTRTPPTSLTAVRGVAWSTAIVTRFPLALA